MKQQAYNPYLPLYEYVPDGEPHVFDGRLYIYGSHDEAGSDIYCAGHYVTWSAPLDNLADWRYEGEIYKRTQDPSNKNDAHQLWAPDITQGSDGRYYLYYCLNFVPQIGVAVSDSPKGPFEYYGNVKYPDHIMNGKDLNEHLPFDPAVFIDDDQKVYLYYGFSPIKPLEPPENWDTYGLTEEEIQEQKQKMAEIETSEGGMVVELEQDMVTMAGEPKVCIPGGLIEEGTGFEGHGFYEASSMRKINGKYYYVYSSKVSHELCYAVSDYPDRGFRYGGILVSNGNLGYRGNTVPQNMMGNNHGGIVEILGKYYVFYHRQTHATESSRQGCAEQIEILPDGRIEQAELTSCGLNGGPLEGNGEYPAAIACHLTCRENTGKITYGESLKEILPFVYQESSSLHYISNIRDGVEVGFKYFRCKNVNEIYLIVRGDAKGKVAVFMDDLNDLPIAEISLDIAGGPMEQDRGESEPYRWNPCILF